ncbi:MAG: hypothetical protein K2X66_06420, partial [Cyanobacteria bacterium]|nr:hypothetical protein [Cyanobacteriota bacterium]
TLGTHHQNLLGGGTGAKSLEVAQSEMSGNVSSHLMAQSGSSSQGNDPFSPTPLTRAVSLGTQRQLTFVQDPGTEKISFTQLTDSAGNSVGNVTGMDGAVVTGMIANQLRLWAKTGKLDNGDSIGVSDPASLKSLAQLGTVMAKYQKKFEVLSDSPAETLKVNDVVIQDWYQNIVASYRDFSQEYQRLNGSGALEKGTPVFKSTLSDLVNLGQNISFYNYLSPTASQDWYTQNQSKIEAQAHGVNQFKSFYGQLFQPMMKLEDLSSSAGSNETNQVSQQIQQLNPGKH